jgi:hypothetical protein
MALAFGRAEPYSAVRRLRVADDQGATFSLAQGTQHDRKSGVKRTGCQSELEKVWVLNQ